MRYIRHTINYGGKSAKKGNPMNISGKKYFQKHFLKIQIEAIFNSILSGLIVGFFAGFAAALVTWMTPIDGLWISVGVTAGVAIISAFVFYFAKFRPTVMRSARRIDSVGLEERLITMVEYENDTSAIAGIQRQDAKKALDALSAAAITLRVATATLICLGVAFTLCAGMTTVTTLADKGIIPDFQDIIEAITPEEQIKYVSVSYEAEDGGDIEGEAEQLIPFGDKTTMIEAIPMEGYEFYEWDDGYKKPVRYEKNVTEDKIFVAFFMPLDAEAQPDQDGDPSDQDQQSKPQKSDQQKEQDKQESDQEQETKPEEDQDKPTNMGGGKYEEVNQIINGEIYYKEVIDEYIELLRERLETEGDSLSQEERAIIESYLGIV